MNKVQTVVKYVLYMVIAFCFGIYLVAYVGAEFGAEWALSIQNWLNSRWGIVLSSATTGALFMVVRFASMVANNSQLSLTKTSKVSDLFNGFLTEAKDSFSSFKQGASEFFGRLTEFKEVIETVKSLSKEMGGINKTVAKLEESVKLIYDLNMYQLAKTEPDEMLAEIKVAAMKSQLIDRAAKLSALLTDPTIAEAEREDAIRVVKSASETLRETKEVARKEIAAEKKILHNKQRIL